VKQSAQVLEWQGALIRLLERRFNKRLPKPLIDRISGTDDLATLTQWFDAAVTSGSLKEFRQLLES
jgi:hypothetical protein